MPRAKAKPQPKAWYRSKTLAVNAAAVAAIATQAATGHILLDPELQTLILGGLNLLLRFLTTQPVR